MTYGQERLRDSPLTPLLSTFPALRNLHSRANGQTELDGATEGSTRDERLFTGSQPITENPTTAGG